MVGTVQYIILVSRSVVIFSIIRGLGGFVVGVFCWPSCLFLLFSLLFALSSSPLRWPWLAGDVASALPACVAGQLGLWRGRLT